MSDNSVSVVVSTYEGNEDMLRQCVDSLNNQVYLPSEIIIVVDTEKEREAYSDVFSEDDLVRVVFSGKSGLAAARNKGIEVSTGDIIAFIDDDAKASENWLQEIVSAFSQEDVAVIGGLVKPVFKGRKISDKLYWIIGCTTTNPPTKRPIGCNMAFSRRVFDDLGGFDESLGRIKNGLRIGEETELILKIRDQKTEEKIIFNPKAVVFHEVPEKRTKTSYILKRAYEEGLYKAIIEKKYDLDVEKKYLRYYIKNLDLITLMVLVSTLLGYIRGKIKG